MNKIIIKANGPLVALGKIRVEDKDGNTITEDDEVYLCRCGHSANKPFCDGAHKEHGFTDAAHIQDDKSEPASGNDPLCITIRENAMLIASGPMSIQNEEDSFQTTRNKAALCRCGHSDNKPFCDGHHKTCGFTAA